MSNLNTLKRATVPVIFRVFIFIGVLMFCVNSYAQNPLIIPQALSGTEFDLELQYGTHEFYSGVTTNTMGANGNILGPTLILQQGEEVTLNVENGLSEVTTMHWHGMHVAPSNDGGPHTTIASGQIWSPSFTVLDKAATYWYHPHLHEFTDEHVSKGIAGMIIVQDDEEAALDLPRTYGVDDFPLVIQTKDFDASGQIVFHSNSDDVAMVNATLDPFLAAPAQLVRLRLLNGSSQRVFNLGLNNGMFMQQIASDGGLLSEPFSTTRLQLAPGERAEILVDLSGLEGQSVGLMSFASEFSNGVYGATVPGMASPMTLDGYNPNPLNGNDFQLLDLQVGPSTSDPVLTVPSSLVELIPLLESSSDVTRNLTFSPVSMGPNQLNGDFLINGASFDMETINYEIPLGNTEIWNITNQTGISHPFHIHDVQFFILDINGVVPPIGQQGLKDVVLIPQMGSVRFITVFEDFADPDVPYMFHCHMLPHEDGGMMGQFIVIDEANGLDELHITSLSLYPNPANNSLTIQTQSNDPISLVKIYDLLGKIILIENSTTSSIQMDIAELSAGSYLVHVQTNKGIEIRKLIKK